MPAAFRSAPCEHVSRRDADHEMAGVPAGGHRGAGRRTISRPPRRADRNGATIRIAYAFGIIVVALCAPVSQAQAMPGAWPQVAAVHSGEAPPAVSVIAVGHTLRSGHYVVRVKEAPSAASAPDGTFDWSDAGVGAAVTVVVGLLVGGARLASRGRRVGAGLNAGSGS